MMEEDSLQGATKRRQLFEDCDTREIYHQKNLDNASQAIITLNSNTFQFDESFVQERIPTFLVDAADVSKLEKKFKETKSENINVQDASQTTNDPRLKESFQKEEIQLESNILVQSNNKPEEKFASIEKVYGINISHSNRLEDISMDSQVKSFNNNQTNHIYYNGSATGQMNEQDYDDISQRTRKIQQKQEFSEVWTRLGSVLFNVKKFLKVLRSQCSYFKYKVLMEHHSLHIIGDKSSFYKGDYDQVSEQSFLNKEEKSCILKFSEPISPDEAIVLVWETYLLGILAMEMFIIPFRSCFRVNMAEISGLFVTLPMITYIIEMLFNLNKGYFDQGNLIVKRKLIVKRYFKKLFFIDLICIFSTLFYQTFQEFEYLSFFFLIVRISQVQRLSTKLDESYQLQFKYPEATELIRLMLTIIFIAHVTGCGFHFLGKFISDGSYNWLEKYKIYDLSVVERYINSLYYAFITMVTVGYGDIVPISKIEKIYVICMTLVSCGVFAYSVNTIGTIFRDLSKKQFHLKQDKFQIQQYMQNRKINIKLQRRVLRALEYAEQQEQKGSQQGEQILKKVQIHLQNDIKQDFFGKILLNHKIFQLNFSRNFLKQLSLKMSEKLLARDDILFQQGDIDENYYIVLSGSLEIYVMMQEQVHIGSISTGTGVGQRGFFTGVQREFYVKSPDITRVVYINRQSFLEIVKNYPQDFEKFCYLRDMMLLDGKEFDIKCFACKQFTHTILECPIINPKHNFTNSFISTIIASRFKDQDQPRRLFERRRQNKYNLLVNSFSINHKLKQLRLKICGIINDIPRKSSNEIETNHDLEEIYQNLSDFEFYMRLPEIKMMKSIYNEMMYELIVNNQDEQIIEDIPLLEYVQEYLKMQDLNKSNNEDRETDYNNDATEIMINNIANEPSIANENNCGNINITSNNNLIGQTPSNLVNVEPLNSQLAPQISQGNFKKSKTQSSLAVQKNMKTKQVSIDLDAEVFKEQTGQNQNQTDIYFQSLEKKSNITPFEQEILKQYKQSTMLLQSQKFPQSALNTFSKPQFTCDTMNTKHLNEGTNELDYKDFPESPLVFRKQGLMNQIQYSLSTIKTALISQYGDGSSNSNSNFNPRQNKRKSTKKMSLSSNEQQILNQLSKHNTNISNQITSVNSSEHLQELKNSIKVHHAKGNSSEKTSNYTTNNPTQNTNQNNNQNINQNSNSVHSKGNQSNRQQQQEQYQLGSFKQIGVPSSNLINVNLKARQSALINPDDFNTIAKSLQIQRSKQSYSDQFWSIIDFEVFKSYERYYPQNNIEGVINKYNYIQDRKVRMKNLRNNRLNRAKTFIFLNKCTNNPNTPEQKNKFKKRRGAEKSFLANVYNNISIQQINKSGILSEKRKHKLKDCDNSSIIQSRNRKITYQSSFKQRSSSEIGKLTDLVEKDISII